MTETVYIGLGSNLGDRERFLAAAVSRLSSQPGLEVIAVSSLYLTRPQDMEAGSPPFLNQVVKADCELSPEKLLSALETIEEEFGRTDKGERLPRTIDLDILLFGQKVVKTQDLTIPHAKLKQRPFVLVPLLQIDDDIVYPGTIKSLASYLTDEGKSSVKLYKDHVAREV